MPYKKILESESVIRGEASGELLVSSVGLSFWGGVDPSTGIIIDQHHPLHGQSVTGKILVLPSGRGSCSGSGAMLELLLNEVGPAALVLLESEDILTLGVLVAQVMFDRSIPICRIREQDLAVLRSGMHGQVSDEVFSVLTDQPSDPADVSAHKPLPSRRPLTLSDSDQQMLDGSCGKAAQLAMQIVLHMGELQGAKELVDVSQAHIDACVYHGPSSLLFAQRLATLGGVVRVPTTLNSLSVDKRRWREQGVAADFGAAASALGDAYMAMGAKLSYTCAPYLLSSAPQFGEQIVWAESNAVTFANSIIGARTQKYPDFLDICIALTGRAPLAGAHLDSGRLPTINIQVMVQGQGIGQKSDQCIDHSAVQCTDLKSDANTDANTDQNTDQNSVNAVDTNVQHTIKPEKLDDSFWPLLGYHIGAICKNEIPMVCGLEKLEPTLDDHKAFSAAFATTSSVPMYHLNGLTPEADTALESMKASGVVAKSVNVDTTDLLQSWNELNSATVEQVDLVCLGNPHFSLTECEAMAQLCDRRTRSPSVGVVVTLGRDTHEKATAAGYIENLERFGVQFINDTCWCMLEEPVIPIDSKVLMTNSGKYAHYGPGLVDRPMHFGSLADCVSVACSGQRNFKIPDWLASAQ